MTNIRKLAFVGLASLGLFTIGSVGCSSSNNSGTGGSTGNGGSTGAGGTSHTGGSTGNGGTGSGTGGAGGAAATVGCQSSDAPTSADIATFASADAGLTIMGGFFVYGSTPTPQYTPATGSVTVTDTVQVGAANNYQGFGIYFNGNSAGTDCIDAHTYTGVQFDISGSLTGTGCTIQFSINDSEHSDSTVTKSDGTPNDPKAAGPKGSYSPQLNLPATDFTATPMTIKVPFTGTGAPTGGSPAITTTPLDPTKIEGVQWQMTTPIASDGGATQCELNMTLANIKFYSN